MKVLAMLILVLVCFLISNASFAETAYEKYQRVGSVGGEWYFNFSETYISKRNLGCKNIVQIGDTLAGSLGMMLASGDGVKNLMKSMPGHKLESFIGQTLDILFKVKMVPCQKN